MVRKTATKKPAKSAAAKKRIKQIREQFQRDRPSIDTLLASGEYEVMPQGEYLALMHAVAELKKARQQKKLSLAVLSKRTGIDKAALSRLENGQNPNPTYVTLATIARALGISLRIEFDQLTPAAG